MVRECATALLAAPVPAAVLQNGLGIQADACAGLHKSRAFDVLIDLYVYTHIYIYIYKGISYVCVHAYIYIYIKKKIYIHMYIYIHTRTPLNIHVPDVHAQTHRCVFGIALRPLFWSLGRLGLVAN